mgnify:CR=1 FL=1
MDRSQSPEELDANVVEESPLDENSVEESFTLSSILEATKGLLKKEGLTSDTQSRIDSTIEEISDPETKAKLTKLYIRILGLESEIQSEKHNAVLEITQEADIPPSLLEKAFALHNMTGDIEALREANTEMHREGEKRLEDFIKGLQQPYNLLSLTPDLSEGQLRTRVAILDELYSAFKDSSLPDRDKIESVLSEMFGLVQIPNEVQDYLDVVARKDVSDKKEGAENINRIFLGGELRPRVIKITKERHDIDFTSILKLMRDMHSAALHFNHGEQPDGDIQTDFVFNDMTIYKDSEGNYKRMVRQEFAEGQTIKELSPASTATKIVSSSIW